MAETELLDVVELLCSNWDEIRPIIEAVEARTGLSRTQALILWLASQPDDDSPPEAWQTA